ncbi:hypothetical protein NL676_008483 [Syzygium grande]|nr:hypothetical protein NL676_008483 [Syzygium grande]
MARNQTASPARVLKRRTKKTELQSLLNHRQLQQERRRRQNTGAPTEPRLQSLTFSTNPARSESESSSSSSEYWGREGLQEVVPSEGACGERCGLMRNAFCGAAEGEERDGSAGESAREEGQAQGRHCRRGMRSAS